MTFEQYGDVRAQSVAVTNDELIVKLTDGRTISAALELYPRLLHGRPEERNTYELSGGGSGIYWPDLDEDICVGNLALGIHSIETRDSLANWQIRRQLRNYL